MKIKKNFSTPKLCTCKGDISKPWYVYFNFTDPLSGQKKLFRYKLGINTFKTKREREDEASIIILALNKRLRDGWNPLTDQVDEEESRLEVTVSKALDEVLEIKKAFITKESFRTYHNQIKLFKGWLKSSKLDHLYVQNFDKFKAQKFMDYLLRERNYRGKAHNTQLSAMKSFYNAIIERYPVVQINPFVKIKSVPEDSGKNTTYSKEEEERIVTYLRKKNKYFFYATRFVKYCFFRRTELSKLKVKHINWDNKTIVVPSENSKGRLQNSVTIPGSLETIIEEMEILKLDPETFIFGKNFQPSLKKLSRNDDFTDFQRKVNNELQIKEECTFYSWKHTGVCELYNAMNPKDPYVVMRQCRHTDIKMTMIYLRSLGLIINEQVRNW